MFPEFSNCSWAPVSKHWDTKLAEQWVHRAYVERSQGKVSTPNKSLVSHVLRLKFPTHLDWTSPGQSIQQLMWEEDRYRYLLWLFWIGYLRVLELKDLHRIGLTHVEIKHWSNALSFEDKSLGGSCQCNTLRAGCCASLSATDAYLFLL